MPSDRPELQQAPASPPRPKLGPPPPPRRPEGDPRLDSALNELGVHGLHEMEFVDAPPPASRWRRVSTWLIAYAVVLALIAFWPQHVDKGVSGILSKIIAHIPLLTYSRLEFAANIALFVPLGWLLTTLLVRHRHLVLPIAFLVTVTIESVQAVLLAGRTPSVYDIIANTAGACVGMVLSAAAEAGRRRRLTPQDRDRSR
ncbi:MAG: VanZ family protein [Microbacterium sp.]